MYPVPCLFFVFTLYYVLFSLLSIDDICVSVQVSTTLYVPEQLMLVLIELNVDVYCICARHLVPRFYPDSKLVFANPQFCLVICSLVFPAVYTNDVCQVLPR